MVRGWFFLVEVFFFFIRNFNLVIFLFIMILNVFFFVLLLLVLLERVVDRSFRLLRGEIGEDNVEKEIFEVIMNKGVIGLGFLIEGGKVLVKGD